MTRLLYSILIVLSMCFIVQCTKVPPENGSNFNKILLNAKYFEEQSNFDSAQIVYNEALDYAVKDSNELLVAYVHRLKGRVFMLSNDDDSSFIYLNKALESAIKLESDTLKAWTLLNIGSVYRRNRSLDTAVIYFNRALSIFEGLNDSAGMADVLNGLTVAYKYLGAYDKGMEAGLRATYIFRKLGMTDNYIESVNDLGNIYEKLLKFDTALSCYNIVKQMSIEHGLPALAATAYLNSGVIYFRMKDYEDSETEFLKGIEINQKLSNKEELHLAYSNMATLQRKMGDTEKVDEYMSKLLSLEMEETDVSAQLKETSQLGIKHYLEGNYEQSKRFFLENLELAQAAKQKENIKNSCDRLAEIYKLQKDYKQALYYTELSGVYRDSLNNENKQRLIEEHETKAEILYLKDINLKQELEKQQLHFKHQRLKYFLVSAVFILVIVAGFFITFRMRAKKNRIIAAQKIQQLEDEKKLLAAQSVIVGQEVERKRIAQELHDGIGILLSTASIHVSGVNSASKDEDRSEMIAKANELLKTAGKEVRKISQNMMPGLLSKFGLRDAIEDLFDNVSETVDIKIDKQINCTNDRLPENTEIMLYRIIQEMINNTLKHAQANKIIFEITRNVNTLKINYADDGKGFVFAEVESKKSLGLSGIKSRVDFLKGQLTFDSMPGKGVSYTIIIPISF